MKNHRLGRWLVTVWVKAPPQGRGVAEGKPVAEGEAVKP